jgi:hypothetical protein
MEAKLKTNQFWSVLPSSRCWFWKRLGGGAWPNFPGDWWVIPFWVTQRYLAKTRGGTILEPCSWEKKPSLPIHQKSGYMIHWTYPVAIGGGTVGRLVGSCWVRTCKFVLSNPRQTQPFKILRAA